MEKTRENECRCVKTACGCATVTARCSCGETCNCEKECRCGGGCACKVEK